MARNKIYPSAEYISSSEEEGNDDMLIDEDKLSSDSNPNQSEDDSSSDVEIQPEVSAPHLTPPSMVTKKKKWAKCQLYSSDLLLITYSFTIAAKNTINKPAPGPQKLIFNISLFPAAQIKKDIKKHKGKNTYLKLDSNEPFDMWKAQLLTKIDKVLAPSVLDINLYDVSFAVPHFQPSPIMITQVDDYDLMLDRIQKNKDLTASVFVQEKGKPKVCISTVFCSP